MRQRFEMGVRSVAATAALLVGGSAIAGCGGSMLNGEQRTQVVRLGVGCPEVSEKPTVDALGGTNEETIAFSCGDGEDATAPSVLEYIDDKGNLIRGNKTVIKDGTKHDLTTFEVSFEYTQGGSAMDNYSDQDPSYELNQSAGSIHFQGIDRVTSVEKVK